MKKNLLFLVTLMLTMISVNANAVVEKLQKKSLWTEVTSMDELKTSSFTLNDNGTYLYTPSGWDVKACNEATFFASQTTGGMYKLQALGEHYLIPIYDLNGAQRTFWNGGKQFLNSQPEGGNVIFGLAGDNAQHGQDGKDLAVWDVTYEAGKGFLFHCVGRDIYLGHDAEAGRPVDSPVYWTAKAQKLVFDAAEVVAKYNEIKDAEMTEAAKNALSAAQQAYAAEASAANLEAFANAVNDAVFSINMLDVTPGADKTFAIENPDAETSLAYPWTITGRVIDNSGNAHTGRYLFETAGWYTKHGEMTHTVEGLPRGDYQLSVYYMGSLATTAILHGNDAASEGLLGKGDQGAERWQKMTVNCTVGADGKLAIKVETNTEGTQEWGNFDDFQLILVKPFVPNTIPADMYSVTAEVALADGVSEDLVPASFKKYLGEYETVATIEGDEESLTISENKEEGLFNGFVIKGNSVALSADKTITLGGKVFTVRTVDEEENGSLEITADGDDYIMDDAFIYYNGNLVATVANISISKAVEQVKVNVTNVNYDAPTTSYYGTDTKWLTGCNKISGGKVEFYNTSWGVNWITFIGVDGYTMKGAAIKKATLTAEFSGSADSKRATTWGVGFNNTPWAADMTYETADRTITLLDAVKSTTSTKSTTFETLSFDITKAFENGKIATILLYETAGGGGYVQNIKVEFEMAGTPLEAAKAQALEKVEALTVGEGLFTYSQTDIDNYIAAVNAAETVEEVNAIAMPEMSKPEADKLYQMANISAVGTYLGEAKLESKQQPIQFEEAAGGYYIKVNGKYINMAGGNTWSMNAVETASTVWTINRVADGEYTIQGPNGLVGTDNTAAGSATYGNKTAAKNGKWTIVEYEDPTDAQFVEATEEAAKAALPVKRIEDGKLVIGNYNVAGQQVK